MSGESCGLMLRGILINLEQLQKLCPGVQGVEAAECAQLAWAKHFALNMQLQDARQCLTNPLLLLFAELLLLTTVL